MDYFIKHRNSGFGLKKQRIYYLKDKRRGENYMREQFKNEVEVINQCKKLSDRALGDMLMALSHSQPLIYASSRGMSRRIVDVNILVPNTVVEVTFVDGDKQKAVCQEPDVFSLEQAVSICLTKHLLGGTGAYNKAIKNGIKVYEESQREKWRIKTEEERIAKRRAKKAAYMKRRAEKRREEQIEIQKEAYVRALREVEKVNVG